MSDDRGRSAFPEGGEPGRAHRRAALWSGRPLVPLPRAHMDFQVTVRYGGRRQRYHTYAVQAADAREALAIAARELPAEIGAEADLVELRIAVDPDRRGE